MPRVPADRLGGELNAEHAVAGRSAGDRAHQADRQVATRGVGRDREVVLGDGERLGARQDDDGSPSHTAPTPVTMGDEPSKAVPARPLRSTEYVAELALEASSGKGATGAARAGNWLSRPLWGV